MAIVKTPELRHCRWTSHIIENVGPRYVRMTPLMGRGAQEAEADCGSSRVDFLREMATGVSATAVGVTLTGMGIGASPAVADRWELVPSTLHT